LQGRDRARVVRELRLRPCLRELLYAGCCHCGLTLL
jgi:hypothetical protein